jgi:bacterial/archaeal transporter family protein
MSWVLIGILAGLFFAIYNLLLSLSSSNLHAFVGSVALSISSAVVTIAMILLFKMSGVDINFTAKGVKMACFAGIFSAVGSLLYFWMYQKKAPVSVGVPLISISTIIFSALIGLLFLGEKLTMIKIIGLMLAVAGIWVMSI